VRAWFDIPEAYLFTLSLGNVVKVRRE